MLKTEVENKDSSNTNYSTEHSVAANLYYYYTTELRVYAYTDHTSISTDSG